MKELQGDSKDNLHRANWRTSSHSGSGDQCVEVADLSGGRRAVRDSKDPRGPVLLLSAAEWQALTKSLTTAH